MAIYSIADLRIPCVDSRSAHKPVYRVRLSFRFSELVCIRDIAVSSRTSLTDFHTMIQACGNWLNYHCYDFRFLMNTAIVKAEPSWQTSQPGPSPLFETVDSSTMSLKQAFAEFPSMIYSYDYGDGWEIVVSYLNTIYDDMPSNIPCCLFGKGDWPPDDVGGEGGLIRLMATLSDPESEDHEFMKRWSDGQGFEKFNKAKCNQRLKHWEDFAAKTEY